MFKKGFDMLCMKLIKLARVQNAFQSFKEYKLMATFAMFLLLLPMNALVCHADISGPKMRIIIPEMPCIGEIMPSMMNNLFELLTR